jgi:hypothetical protein
MGLLHVAIPCQTRLEIETALQLRASELKHVPGVARWKRTIPEFWRYSFGAVKQGETGLEGDLIYLSGLGPGTPTAFHVLSISNVMCEQQ